ncbi:MAG: SCP2 sterol-binding domain-containing protein [Parasphingorhabdus sp.]|uniref:SCP2 sterol-binding domain-containing protein n=1 Tax=Parasphingorhabdus sp. TaxID=2709688 RepID=UPI00329789CA
MSEVAEQIIAGIKPHLIEDATIGGTIKVDMGDSGTIFFDGTSAPASITPADEPADATMVCSAETFTGIMKGEVDGIRAVMTGKLAVKGNMVLAGKLGKLFAKS